MTKPGCQLAGKESTDLTKHKRISSSSLGLVSSSAVSTEQHVHCLTFSREQDLKSHSET